MPPNQTQFDAGTLELNQFVGNVDVSRAVHGQAASPDRSTSPSGAEYRRENYQIHAGEPGSYGDGGVPDRNGGRAAIGAQVFPGFRPSNEVDQSRSSGAGYVDAEGNIVGWLRLGVAGRAEHYSDFGNTVDGKLTARVQPDPRFVVRGSVSTGFRAPSLGQSFFSSTATNFLNLGPGQGLVPVESLTLPVASAPAQVLGAVPLKPEHSLNTSAGVVITPMSALDVTVDYYRIAIDDRIVLSGNFTGAADRRAARAVWRQQRAVLHQCDRHPHQRRRRDRRTIGSRSARPATCSCAAATTTPAPGSSDRSPRRRSWPALRRCCSIASSSGGSSAPSRTTACGVGGEWRRRRFGVNLNVARYGEFCSTVTLIPADDQEYRPKWLTDLEASYRTAGYTLAVGVQNLFDVFPDRNTTVNSFNGIQTFPSQSPFGMNGRAIYARIGRTF